MKRLQIKTAQNININFTLADVSHRLGAFFLDNILKFIYLYFVFEVFELSSTRGLYTDAWSRKALYVMLMLPVTLYSLYSEILMGGQTVGKMLLKIKVISIDGFKPTIADFIMRWFLRLVDFNFFVLIFVYIFSLGIDTNRWYGLLMTIFFLGKLVGLLLIILTNNNQRLGDLISNTIVIHLKDNAKFSETILENLKVNYEPTYPNVINFSDNDMRLIKDTFMNISGEYKNVKRNRQTLTKLRLKIEEVANIKSKEKNDREFIDKVLKDYNFYTQNG